MYPAGELNDLLRRKAVLRSCIATDRLHCAALAAEAARPLVWIDGMMARWRRISPFAKAAALPLAFFLRRKLIPRKVHLFRGVLRWLPAILGAARAFSAHRRGA